LELKEFRESDVSIKRLRAYINYVNTYIMAKEGPIMLSVSVTKEPDKLVDITVRKRFKPLYINIIETTLRDSSLIEEKFFLIKIVNKEGLLVLDFGETIDFNIPIGKGYKVTISQSQKTIMIIVYYEDIGLKYSLSIGFE